VSRNFELLQQLQVNVDAQSFPEFLPLNNASKGHHGEKVDSFFSFSEKRAMPQVTLRVPTNRAAQVEALKLVHNVFLTNGNAPRRAVVFAGIDSGNGCSQICALGGRALAASVRAPVCLVDANFRSSRGSGIYSPSQHEGLAEALRRPGPIHDFLSCAGPSNLALLPRGRMISESVAFLNSRNMKSRMDDLRSEFGYILIDAPPMNFYADAVALAQATDGIVLILEANSTRRESALRITEQLQAAGVPVLGAVLNKRTFPIPQILYRIL
jgi:Mrp family chromosome partitioning ATPase